jgi:hypothetical protein
VLALAVKAAACLLAGEMQGHAAAAAAARGERAGVSLGGACASARVPLD